MPRGTELVGPWQVEEIALLDTSAGNTPFPVQGWVWWALISARYVLDNSGGAANANAVVSCSGGSGIIYHAFQPTVVAAGAAPIVTFGCFLPSAAMLTFQSAPLPFVPVIGDGAFTVGFTGGNAATAIAGRHVVLVGRVNQPARIKNR